jgi:multiple sugar transport system permease protein
MTYGGPYYATTFIPLLIYEIAFDIFDFGLAAAALVATYILLGLLIGGIMNLAGGQGRADAV